MDAHTLKIRARETGLIGVFQENECRDTHHGTPAESDNAAGGVAVQPLWQFSAQVELDWAHRESAVLLTGGNKRDELARIWRSGFPRSSVRVKQPVGTRLYGEINVICGRAGKT